MGNKIEKKVYYDKYEFEEALSTKNTNILESINKFKKYIEKYPKDYSGYCFYAEMLIINRQLEEAEQVLKNINEMLKYDIDYKKHEKEKYELLKATIAYTTLKLLVYRKEYDQCYKYIMKNTRVLKENEINMGLLLLYCRKQMNKLTERDYHYSEENYVFNQITNYSEERFMNHIQKHLLSSELEDEEMSEVKFYKEFPIEKVLEEIKKIIPNEKGLYTGLIEDAYIIKYNSNGTKDNKNMDYFRVIAFHDTNKLITIYPTFDCRYLPCIDLNYLKEDEKPKVKRLSQLEKFNQKYGIKLDK